MFKVEYRCQRCSLNLFEKFTDDEEYVCKKCKRAFNKDKIQKGIKITRAKKKHNKIWR